MTKYRGFMVVLHDVHLGTQSGKQWTIDHLMLREPEKAVVAREPYGHQEGQHIHVFYRMKAQSYFKTELKHWVVWASQLNVGRCEVNVMHGSMAQACRYLMKDYTKKEKNCDPSPWFYPTIAIIKSPSEHADEWMDWFLSTSIDEWKQISIEHRDKFLVGWATSQEAGRNKNIGIC